MNRKPILIVVCYTGAVLRNVKDSVRQKVVLLGVPQAKILEAERLTDTPEKLALALLLTQEELSQGNCTKPMRSDIQQLDSERLWAIKCKDVLTSFQFIAGHIILSYLSWMEEKAI